MKIHHDQAKNRNKPVEPLDFGGKIHYLYRSDASPLKKKDLKGGIDGAISKNRLRDLTETLETINIKNYD